MFKSALAFAGAAALVASFAVPVSAQDMPLPAGSYQQSCSHYHMHGPILSARCGMVGGGSTRSTINVNRCHSDIWNSNGQLSCRHHGHMMH